MVSENTSLHARLDGACRAAFAAAGFDAGFGAVRVSDRPDIADFQCNGLLAVAKKNRIKPADAAAAVMAQLDAGDLFGVEVVGPGFMNFTVTDAALANHAAALAADPGALVPPSDAPTKYLLDYGGPNLAKEMHVGHLRSAIIGQALNQILTFAGHKTVSDVHLGDWGLQMGQLISYIEDIRPDLLEPGNSADIAMDDLQDWYPKASALSKADAAFQKRAQNATAKLQARDPAYTALWERIRDASVASLKRDYGRLGVAFDQWYGESRYQDALAGIVDRLLADGTAVEDDGAVIVRMVENPKLPPLILRNARGGFGYGATDLATIADRVAQDDPDTILYVVDGRQGMHFKQVFDAARQAGLLDSTTVEHTAFGTVNGTDGKPFKTRAGGVMRLHDLIETMTAAARARLDEAGHVPEGQRDTVAAQIAIAAIRFGELSHDREKDYVFSVEQFLQFEGRTGPYIQYACVRVRGLVQAAADAGLEPGPVAALGEGGRDLILALDDLPAQLDRTIQQRKPHNLANHIFRLADATNRYYQQNRVLGGDAQAAPGHLTLLQAATAQLALCLDVIGIAIPDAM